ncbi:hypothetical protein L9F63_004311, partial [Diploptera punctata]
ENPTKSHSTCSDGSLLSMGSSEMDEDSLCQNSGHSSKLSLHDKMTYHENDLELDIGVSAAPLSHSAAKHKMAVRPKRTHGEAMVVRLLAGASPLPSTPELNEDTSGRSASPDIKPSKEDIIASEDLCTTNDIFVDEVTIAWPSDDGMKTTTNILPAETQLKSASLPPGLALTPEMSNTELPAAAKVKRCNSSIAQRQNELATAAMQQHLQRSISEDSAKHQSRVIKSTETTTKSFLRSGIQTDTQRTFGTVGEEDEYIKDDDPCDEVSQKEKYKDEKKKDDSSFFSRLIRRSGKKKKEISQDTLDSLTITSSNSYKPFNEPSVVPKRIDLKGRYANESINDLPSSQHYPPPKQPTGKFGGSRSTPASRQRVMPINIPASPEGPRKAETNREVEEVTVGLPLPTSPAPEPESLSANRMQVSYSTSPPKPMWPESNNVIYNKQPSRLISQWHDVPDNTAQVHDVQHFRSKLRVTGLSSYQHRMNNDDREYTSLIDTVSNNESAEAVAARQNAVKKSKSFRRESETLNLSPNLPSFSNETDTDVLKSSIDNTTQNYEKPRTKSVCDSVQKSVEQESTEKKEDPSLDINGRLFTKNTVITARSVVKEISNVAESRPVARIYNSRHPDRMMKKSSSLDSIGSFGDSRKSPTSDAHMSSKKSSSSESINSLTQQTTVPVYAEAISITHNTRKEVIIKEERKIFSKTSSAENIITAQPSQVTTSEKVNSSDVPKPVSPAVLSTKPSVPEISKPVDVTPIPSEPTSRLSNPTVERNINKVEQSQAPTPQRNHTPRIRSSGGSTQTEQVPEFLKVQLNRVDNKPVTSMVFDSTERSYSPLKSSEIRQTGLRRKESVGKLIEKNDIAEIVPNGADISSQISNIKERKSNREDVTAGGNLVYHSQTETNTNKTTDLSTTAALTEETGKDPTVKTVEDEVPVETTSSQKQRCKSLPSSNQVNGSNRNYSIVSISSTPSSKPMLKKQAISLDSADSSRYFMKKQISNDSDDITMITKTGTQDVVQITNLTENSSLRKKSITKEHGSWKDDESVSSEKSENSSVEVVLRSKKIISSKDFGIKKDEDIQSIEKRISGESVENKKLGIWREDESQKEKQTTGTENSNSQETNNNSSSGEVILRKKSLSRGEINRNGGKDDEPELLKVFARRSLKLKDNECENLGQQVGSKSRSEVTPEQGTKSRDSDKENEGGDSPREERKKQMIKEPLAESKIHIESSEAPPVLKTSSTGITTRNGSIVSGSNKYTRSLSGSVTLNNDHTIQNNESSLIYRKENPGLSPDKRQRNRTIPESPKTDTNIEKTPHRAWANIYREKEMDITNNDTKKSNMDKQGETNDDNSIPRFKRIQQMKEEWELRAQGLKKTLP